jgi:2-polyprenyl-3-methyl-5-hydroxy-6-metoxy-1,4-benzoquinol methylase
MICPLCGNRARTVWHEKKYQAFRCTLCKAAFLDPLPPTNKNHYNKNYFSQWYLSNAQKRIAYLSSILKEIPVLSSSPATLLDVGCGAGFLLKIMQNRGWSVEGQDTSPSAAALCEKEGFSIYRQDLSTLQGEEKYDVITLFDVIAHISDPLSYLKACKRLLRNNGTIIIKTPLHPPALFALCRALSFTGKSRSLLHIPAQLFHFTPQSLSSLLKQEGFSDIHLIVKPEGMFHAPGSIAFIINRVLKTFTLHRTLILYGKK